MNRLYLVVNKKTGKYKIYFEKPNKKDLSEDEVVYELPTNTNLKTIREIIKNATDS